LKGETGAQGLPGNDGKDGSQGPQGETAVNDTQGPPSPIQIPATKLYTLWTCPCWGPFSS